jgi:hypothetical protein
VPLTSPSTFAACRDATVDQNQDRALVQYAVLNGTVRSEMARNVMVLIVKAQTGLVQNAMVLIDSVLNEGIRIADSLNVKDVRNFPDAKVVLEARFVVEAAHCVAAAANFVVLQLEVQVHCEEFRHVAEVRYVAAVVHTTETVSQRVARALKARRVHDYVSASHLDPV